MNDNEFDPVDVLRELADASVPHGEPSEELHAQVLELGPSVVGGRQARRRRLVAAIVAIGIVAIGGAAAASWWPTQPSRPEAGISCRSNASLDGDAIVLEPGADPIEACGVLWESGQISAGGISSLPAPQAVPLLTACVGSGGALEVYPAPAGVCAELGLADAPLQLGEDEASAIELQSRIADFNGERCHTERDALARAEAMLDALGMADWTVAVGMPGGPDLTCAALSVDSSRATVSVFFLPAEAFSTTTTEGE